MVFRQTFVYIWIDVVPYNTSIKKEIKIIKKISEKRDSAKSVKWKFQ